MEADHGPKWTSPEGVVTYLGAKYYVSGYAGPKHPQVRAGRMKVGDLLLTTWNIGSSKDMEVQAWKDRMARGEVSRIDVVLDYRVVESYGPRDCP